MQRWLSMEFLLGKGGDWGIESRKLVALMYCDELTGYD